MVVARNLCYASTAMVEAHYGHMATSYVSEAIRKYAPRFGGTKSASNGPGSLLRCRFFQMARAGHCLGRSRRSQCLRASSNPVIRNGALLSFDDRTGAHRECDRLNARPGNPHVRYTVKRVARNRPRVGRDIPPWPSAPQASLPSAKTNRTPSSVRSQNLSLLSGLRRRPVR